MYERILVPLDGSDLAEIALPYAREISECLGSEIHMLGVCDEPRLPERLLTAYVERLVEGFHNSGLRAKSVVICGPAAESIMDYGEQNHMDLILMTTHGRSGFSRVSLGSVAEKVMHAGKLPLLLINAKLAELPVEERRAFHRILLPLDGSALGESALPHVEELARRVHARVILLSVVSPPFTMFTVQEYPVVDWVPVMKAQMEKTQAYLNRIAERFKTAGVSVSTQLLEGPASENILDYAKAEKVDLIAMSTHGRSGLGRWIMGSVAAKVLRAADCPVLLERAKGAP